MPTPPALLPVALLALLALGAIAPPMVSLAQAQPAAAAPATALVLRGQVDGVNGWLVHTTIPVTGAPGAALEDGDGLQVELGGRRFFARFVSPERYAILVASPGARETLDAAVVCTSDARGDLVIAPLGGDLRDLLPLETSTSVVVVRP